MSKPMSDSGKGSFRRNEDTKKVHDNWDRIFGKGKTDMNEHDDEPQERSAEDMEQSDEWCCECCGGPMYRQAHWSYGQCDDCGARQELEDDF